MATLFFHPSTFLSFSSSSHKFFLSHHHHHLNWNPQEHPLRQHFTFTVAAASFSPNKSSRSSRKVKSNEELCNDIRAFLSMVGLPNDHVPTMKELSDHGRSDLANIVRRRGYRLIRELLASSTKTDFDGSIAEEGVAGQDKRVNNEVKEVSLSDEEPRVGNYFTNSNSYSNQHPNDHIWTPIESLASSSLEEKESYILNGQNQNVNNIIEDISIASNASVMKNNIGGQFANTDPNSGETSLPLIVSSSSSCSEEKASFNVEVQHEETDSIAENISLSTDMSITENCSSGSNSETSSNFVSHVYTPQETSASTTLEEKVAKFIQNGELDMIEDNFYGILNGSNAEESEEVEHSKCAYNQRGDGAGTLNGSALTSKQSGPSATMNHPLRDDHLASEEPINADFDKDFDVETSRVENALEVNHLKFMLHQKEMELSRLKEEIEREQHALSVLQTKVEMEINKAQKLISEKDAELRAVEESLSGLEEVQIQYSGDGEIVELAGSFNGWQQKVKMDPQPLSRIIEPIGPSDVLSTKSRLWSTVLWLYPGIYEIKFIVDGQWRIDPQRESVSRGGIMNNILRVDR